MKKILSLLTSLVLVLPAQSEEESSKELLRNGLFEEEVNQDYQKAKAAYQSVTKRYDKERYFAGLAFFRLAEIARKSGDQDEAIALYRRVANEFADQKEIAKRAAAQLGDAGVVDQKQASDPTSPSNAEALELRRLKRIERDSPDLLNGVGEDGWHPLHKAAANGWTNAIDFLLKRKVKIDPRTSVKGNFKSDGYTPLHLAVIHGHLTVVDQLLAAKADPGLLVQLKPEDLPLPVQSNSIPTDSWGEWSPLHLAILFQRREIMSHLLKAKAPLSANGPPVQIYETDTSNRSKNWIFKATPLILAVWLNDKVAFQTLIDHGADLNQATSEDGETPLLAAIWKNSDLITALIDQGAKVTDQFLFGRTALHWAIEKSESPVIQRIIQEGADVNLRVKLNRYSTERNPSPLEGVLNWTSGQKKRDELCQALLAAGARPSPPAMINATSNSEFQIMNAFIKSGIDPNGSSHDGDRPLHYVKHVKAAQILVEAGAHLEVKNHDGISPFERIVKYQEDTPRLRALVDFFLEKGADASGIPSLLSSQPEAQLLPYVMSKTALVGKSNPKAITLAFPRTWHIEIGEDQVLPGTPAPTMKEFLNLNFHTLNSYQNRKPVHATIPSSRRSSYRPPGPTVVTDLVIYRPNEKGELVEIAQLANHGTNLKSAPALQWGDVVIFRVGSKKNGKQQMPLIHYVSGLESRTVTFKVGPWKSKVTIENTTEIAPGLELRNHFSPQINGIIDLEKVTLRRAGGESKTINLSLTNNPKKIRLIDGDVIEYALKEQVDPSKEDPFAPSASTTIHLFYPDRPAGSLSGPRNREVILSEFLNGFSFVGGRDFSKILIQRMTENGLEKIPLDLAQASRNLTNDNGTTEKAIELLNTKILPGDILVLPPKENISWQQRNKVASAAGNAQIGNLFNLIKPVPRSRPTPTRTKTTPRPSVAPNRRTVPKPSK